MDVSINSSYPLKERNYLFPKVPRTKITIYFVLILIIHIISSSLVKAEPHRDPVLGRKLGQFEDTNVNKVSPALWEYPDVNRGTRRFTSPLVVTLPSEADLAHYKPHTVGIDKGKLRRKTNLPLGGMHSIVSQDDPNENDGRSRESDNNDRDDDENGGRRGVSSKKIKTTTKPSTFDLTFTTGRSTTTATTATSAATSTFFSERIQVQARKLERLKNYSESGRKVARTESYIEIKGDVGSGKNDYDKYHGTGQLRNESEIKKKIFPRQVEMGEAEEAAIESLKKAFVTEESVSKDSGGGAAARRDMGILEKFEVGPKSLADRNDRSRKTLDKKSILGGKQLFPSEHGEENNNVLMPGLKNLISTNTSVIAVEGTGESVSIKTDGSVADDAASVGSAETESEDAGGATTEEEDEKESEIVISSDEDDDDNHEEDGVVQEVEFDGNRSEGAPEGTESMETSSSAHFADFDKVGGKRKSGRRQDFVDSASSAASTATADEVKLYRLVQRLLKESPLIDGHNDLPWNLRKFLYGQLLDFDFNADLRSIPPWSTSRWSHTDLPRLRRGLVGAQFWVAYAPCESQNLNAVQITLEQIDLIRRLIARYPEHLTLALSADDIEKAHREGKIASLIAVEGGHAIGSSLSTLRSFYDLGVRYMTLTHNCNTPWADSARPGHKPEHGGLTEFGRAVVREMNRLGMLVDLSHTSKLTMKDALKESKAPVIFSHSSAFALCNSSRNVPDDILKELVWNRGIIMVTFYNIYVKCAGEATVKDVADHINYIRGKISIEHIGIGSDFDGINLTPVGLEDVSRFPNLFVELARTPNWSNDELKKVAGRNFLRVFREVERIRDTMRSAGTTASFELIPPRDFMESTRCRLNISSPVSSIHR